MKKKIKIFNRSSFNLAISWLKKNKFTILLISLFTIELLSRFYQMDVRTPFGYDQVDNAWAAKRLIIEHKFPIVGMVAKQNSGIYIGPLYYYFVSIFYFLTNLNPVASNLIAGVTSIFTFWTIYLVTKKLFNKEVALIAAFINTFSYLAIIFDGIQWPVNFLPSISLIIFYLLYKIINGDVKKLIYLALAVGIVFNIHFTAIFFPIIVFLSLPLFPWNFNTIKYILVSTIVFIIFLIPNLVFYILNSKAYASNSSYLSSYYHGFHLRRFVQLVNDQSIEFVQFLLVPWLGIFRSAIVPIFFVVYWLDNNISEKKKFLYLVGLWFVVPWLVFTTYKGEISDYYFVGLGHTDLAIAASSPEEALQLAREYRRVRQTSRLKQYHPFAIPYLIQMAGEEFNQFEQSKANFRKLAHTGLDQTIRVINYHEHNPMGEPTPHIDSSLDAAIMRENMSVEGFVAHAVDELIDEIGQLPAPELSSV